MAWALDDTAIAETSRRNRWAIVSKRLVSQPGLDTIANRNAAIGGAISETDSIGNRVLIHR